MQINIRTFIAAIAVVMCVGFQSVNAADANLNNGWEAFPTPESKAAAIKLGQALFWDEQLGSGNGGQYACASCHYQAGADSHPMRIEAGRLPNGINGSLGVAATPFIATTAVTETDGSLCAQPAEQFGPVGALHITGRNAPPAVDSNSIHNFWDGRANFVFNGLDPSGEIRPELYTENGMKSVMILESSQASQAVGPVNSDVEMAAGGRSFLDVGFKMCHVIPLCTQTGDVVEQVKADGNYVPGGYVQMIKDAFGAGPLAEFVSDLPAPGRFVNVCVDGAAAPELCPCTITEANFTLFFGLAVQAYEQTLSTQPAQQPIRAMKRAFKEMRCDKCHYEDGRSHAVTGDVGNRPFSVTGVAPLAVDPGATVANLNLNSPFPNDEAEADAGFFKSTHLFNLPLIAPYFHDGSAATIKDMLDFYVRGGNHDLPDLNSHVRVLDATPAEQQLVIEMMEVLTDPRIAAGTGPYAHPSLKLPLAYGTFVQMRATDDPVALADANPGLSYVHVTATGETIGEAPAIGGGAGDAGAGAGDAGAGAGDAGNDNKKKRREKRNRNRRRSR